MGTFRTSVGIENIASRGRIAGITAADHVVFAEPGDLVLLGARSLEGLNLRVDARRKQLVSAGPIVVAAAA